MSHDQAISRWRTPRLAGAGLVLLMCLATSPVFARATPSSLRRGVWPTSRSAEHCGMTTSLPWNGILRGGRTTCARSSSMAKKSVATCCVSFSSPWRTLKSLTKQRPPPRPRARLRHTVRNSCSWRLRFLAATVSAHAKLAVAALRDLCNEAHGLCSASARTADRRLPVEAYRSGAVHRQRAAGEAAHSGAPVGGACQNVCRRNVAAPAPDCNGNVDAFAALPGTNHRPGKTSGFLA